MSPRARGKGDAVVAPTFRDHVLAEGMVGGDSWVTVARERLPEVLTALRDAEGYEALAFMTPA